MDLIVYLNRGAVITATELWSRGEARTELKFYLIPTTAREQNVSIEDSYAQRLVPYHFDLHLFFHFALQSLSFLFDFFLSGQVEIQSKHIFDSTNSLSVRQYVPD